MEIPARSECSLSQRYKFPGKSTAHRVLMGAALVAAGLSLPLPSSAQTVTQPSKTPEQAPKTAQANSSNNPPQNSKAPKQNPNPATNPATTGEEAASTTRLA